MLRIAPERFATLCFACLFFALVVMPAATLSLSPAHAADEPPADQSPGELAREGMDRMLEAITRLIQMIPQYDAPEILDNGDILIRRRHPEGEEGKEETPPDVVETNT